MDKAISSSDISDRLRAVSPFSCPFERNPRDIKMTKGVAEGVRRERHSSLSFLRLTLALSPKTEDVDGAVRRLNNRDLVINRGY